MKFDLNFYTQNDVVSIAKSLVGSKICVNSNNELTEAIIVETEAYSYKEKGCHAYNYKRTRRTEIMFRQGGIAYVYLCYGIHHLFNVVTNIEGIPEAVLIRAVSPVTGVDIMEKRRKQKGMHLTSGPGKLTKAMGITLIHNGTSLLQDSIWIEQKQSVT